LFLVFTNNKVVDRIKGVIETHSGDSEMTSPQNEDKPKLSVELINDMLGTLETMVDVADEYAEDGEASHLVDLMDYVNVQVRAILQLAKGQQ